MGGLIAGFVEAIVGIVAANAEAWRVIVEVLLYLVTWSIPVPAYALAQ